MADNIFEQTWAKAIKLGAQPIVVASVWSGTQGGQDVDENTMADITNFVIKLFEDNKANLICQKMPQTLEGKPHLLATYFGDAEQNICGVIAPSDENKGKHNFTLFDLKDHKKVEGFWHEWGRGLIELKKFDTNSEAGKSSFDTGKSFILTPLYS